jgi:hypothetical protein
VLEAPVVLVVELAGGASSFFLQDKTIKKSISSADRS